MKSHRNQHEKSVEKGQQNPRSYNESKYIKFSTRTEAIKPQNPTLQCLGCGGPNYTKKCPYCGIFEQVTNI